MHAHKTVQIDSLVDHRRSPIILAHQINKKNLWIEVLAWPVIIGNCVSVCACAYDDWGLGDKARRLLPWMQQCKSSYRVCRSSPS